VTLVSAQVSVSETRGGRGAVSERLSEVRVLLAASGTHALGLLQSSQGPCAPLLRSLQVPYVSPMAE